MSVQRTAYLTQCDPQFALLQSGETKRIERLSSTGTPIGLLPGRGYTQSEIQLSAGEVALADRLPVHFIGQLQSNKIKQ